MSTKNVLQPVSSSVQPEEAWMTVDGVRIRYLRAGSGPALLLLHGLLGYSFSWRFNISVLAQLRTVYAVDMPGAGFSERSQTLDCSFGGSAQRLLHFADRLGLANFDLLGTSHGGAVAMMAAAIGNPSSRIRKLILVAPVNPWSAHGRDLAPFLSGPMISRVLGRCMPKMGILNAAIVRRLYGDARRISPGTVEGYSKPYRSNGSFAYVFNILKTWNRDLDELEYALSRIADLPILLMWGTSDAAVDPKSARVLANHFRNCELVQFPGVGHLPYEEVPDDFNAAVKSFLMKENTFQV